MSDSAITPGAVKFRESSGSAGGFLLELYWVITMPLRIYRKLPCIVERLGMKKGMGRFLIRDLSSTRAHIMCLHWNPATLSVAAQMVLKSEIRVCEGID